MAAEYQLHTKDEIEVSKFKNVFTTLYWQYVEEKIGSNGLMFSPTYLVGLILYLINNSYTIEMGTQKLIFKNTITFRFIKEVNFLISKRNMLKFIVKLIKIYEGDFILLFNGEIVIMMKNQEEGLVLSNTNFWDDELIKELDNANFIRKSFQVL